MAVLAQISLGVHDCERAGAFWSEALGYVRRPPRCPGDDWIVIEPPAGVPGAPPYVVLADPEGNRFCVRAGS